MPTWMFATPTVTTISQMFKELYGEGETKVQKAKREKENLIKEALGIPLKSKPKGYMEVLLDESDVLLKQIPKSSQFPGATIVPMTKKSKKLKKKKK